MAVALTPNAFLVRNVVGSPSSLSWCGWTRIDVDRGQFTILRYLAANIVGGGGFQPTVNASRRLIVFRANDFADLLAGAGPILPVGQWWFLGLTTIVDDVPNNVVIYRAPEGAGSLTATTVSYSGAYQYANHYIGARPGADGSDGAFRLHGSAEHDRVWHGVTLTPAEMLAEYQSPTPVKAGAWAVWPMADSATATVDASGNSRPLTATPGTGTITTTDSPFDTSTVEASLTATLPALTSDLASAAIATGVASATLPDLSTNIGATASIPATLDATLPALTADLVGRTLVDATLSATMPTLTASTTGAVEASGELAASLPSLAASTTAALAITAEPTATLPALQAAIAAGTTVDAALDVALPGLTASLDTSAAVEAQVDASLPELATTLEVDATAESQLVAGLPALNTSTAGTVAISSELAATLPALTAAFTEEEIVTGAITGVLSALTVSFNVSATADVLLTVGLPALVASFAALTEDKQTTLVAGTYREPSASSYGEAADPTYRDPAGLTYRESAA